MNPEQHEWCLAAQHMGGRGDFNTIGYNAGKSAADKIGLKANAMEGNETTKELE